jgi:hypothetical protein
MRYRRKPHVLLQHPASALAEKDERIVKVTGPDPDGPSMLLSVRFTGSTLVVEPFQLSGDAQVMEPTRVDGRKAELLVSMRGEDQQILASTAEVV